MWSVCLGSAEEFNLYYWLTLVFAWAKIRTFNAFLRLRRERQKKRETETEKSKGRKGIWDVKPLENKIINRRQACGYNRHKLTTWTHYYGLLFYHLQTIMLSFSAILHVNLTAFIKPLNCCYPCGTTQKSLLFSVSIISLCTHPLWWCYEKKKMKKNFKIKVYFHILVEPLNLFIYQRKLTEQHYASQYFFVHIYTHGSCPVQL